MFLHLSVILCTGGSASVHAGMPPPGAGTPPQEHAHPGTRHLPRTRHTPQEQAPTPGLGTPPPPEERRLLLRMVHILLECILLLCVNTH